MIKEVIVVEGRDDIRQVKKALDCECVATHGYGFGEDLLRKLDYLQEKRGLIILTDPDYAGKRIRARILDRIPEAKQAFMPREKSIKGDDIGIENSLSEDIVKAIGKARPEYIDIQDEYTMEDILAYGLTGENSKEKRIFVGDFLGIGYYNSKQILIKLNNFGVERSELEKAILAYEKDKKGEGK